MPSGTTDVLPIVTVAAVIWSGLLLYLAWLYVRRID
jgi:hypothetical protein